MPVSQGEISSPPPLVSPFLFKLSSSHPQCLPPHLCFPSPESPTSRGGRKLKQPGLFTPFPALPSAASRIDFSQVVGGTEGASTPGSLHPTPNPRQEQRDRAKSGRGSQICLSLQIFAAPEKLLYKPRAGFAPRKCGSSPHQGRGWKTRASVNTRIYSWCETQDELWEAAHSASGPQLKTMSRNQVRNLHLARASPREERPHHHHHHQVMEQQAART